MTVEERKIKFTKNAERKKERDREGERRKIYKKKTENEIDTRELDIYKNNQIKKEEKLKKKEHEKR